MKWILCVALAIFVRPASCETVTVAVASNFVSTFKQLVKNFEQHSSHRVRTVSGSSGKLYAQITQGAPYQLFLSADQVKPQQLARSGLGHQKSVRTYVFGQLSLWSNAPFLRERRSLDLREIFQLPEVRTIAIANPELAPYGAAARQVLTNMSVIGKTKKVVYGENVAQALHFVRSGNAQLGIIARSLANADKQGASWSIPSASYSPIRQDMILLGKAPNAAARDLHAFLMSESAQEIMRSAGYKRAIN